MDKDKVKRIIKTATKAEIAKALQEFWNVRKVTVEELALNIFFDKGSNAPKIDR